MRRYTMQEKLAAVAAYRESGRLRETGRRTGISRENIRRWDALLSGGALYHGGAADGREGRVESAPRSIDELPDDPAELKRIILEQQFQIDLARAVVEVVKKDRRVDPSALTNREKAAVIDAMRPAYSLTFLTSRLGIAPSTYHYNHAALARPDKHEALRGKIRAICERHRLTWGYRRVKLELEGPAWGEVRSEKVVLRLMREEGLLAAGPKAAGYSSYSADADGSDLPNVPLRGDGTHDFSAPAPNVLWLTDVTQMRIPAGRVFLSPVLDCFDGLLAGWAVSTAATAEALTDPSLRAACAALREGDAPTLHTDRGAQYHARSWIAICERHGVTRSMSRKGHSPDNARMEGFFALLKREFFYCRDWEGVSVAEFCAQLDAWLRWYNDGRKTTRLGWMSPVEYRKSLGLCA
jgi:putative transposase